MPNDLSMIFNVIARDGASPAFRTVAAEAKALAAAMADADAKMTATTRAATAEIDTSIRSMAKVHRDTMMQVIRDDQAMVDVTRASAAEMSAANDELAASIAASSKAMVAAQREAMASTDALGTEMVAANTRMEKTSAERAASVRKSMNTIGFVSAAALAVIGYESVKAATSFEASMARVQTMAGASSNELKQMSKGILDLAPKVGVGPDKLAESLYHVESAGFHGAKALDMVTASAKLSAIGQDDINSSTQAVVATLASNIKGVRDANDAAAQILHTVGTGDMTMHQFTQALGTGLLATAAAVGLSFRDVGAAIATMTDNAIPADQAATKLRTSLLMMVNPSKPAAAALASIGMNTTALAGDLQKPDGLKTALDDIRTHLNAAFPKDGGIPLTIDAQRRAVAGYRQELATAGVQGKQLDKAVNTYADSLKTGTTNTVLQEQAFAKMFGGSKNAGTMLVLFNEQLDRMDPKLASYGDATSRAAEMQAAWAKQQDTFKQKLNQLSATFDVMKIKIGNALLPVLKDVIGFMGSHTGMVEAFAFAIGTVLVGATVAWTVALQTNPVVLFVEALVLVGVEIYLLITHFKQVTEFLRGPWGTAISIAVAVTLPFIGIPALIIAHWGAISHFFQHIWHDITAWFFDAWHAINGVARDIGGAADAIGRFFERMWHDVSGFAARMWHDVAGFFSRMWHDVAGFAARIYHDVAGPVGAAVDFISRHWRTLITIFMGPIGFVIALVYKFRDQIGSAFTTMWHVVSTVVGALGRFIVAIFRFIWLDVSGTVTTLWHWLVAVATTIWHAVSAVFTFLWHAIKAIFRFIWLDVTGTFGSMWHWLVDAATIIWHTLTAIFTFLWRALVGVFRFIWLDVSGTFATLWHWLVDVATKIWHEVESPMQSLWDGLKRGFDDVVGWIKTAWSKLGEIFAAPIRFLVHYVYDDGVVKVWNAVMDVLGEKGKLNPVDFNAIHFATGGVIPGNHNRDDVPFFGTPGEVVVPKPVVNRYGGPDSLMAALGFDGKNGGTHFGIGGVLGDIGHNIAHPGFAVRDLANILHPEKALQGAAHIAGDVVHALAGLVRGALADTAGPLLNTAVTLLGKLVPGTDHGWGKSTVTMGHTIVDKVMNWIRGQDAKDQAAMGGLLGGEPINWNGGPFTVGLIEALAKTLPFGNQMQPTSTTGGGHAGGSYHYKGEAVDFSNGFGNTPQMLAFDQAWAAKYGSSLAELIYTAPGSVFVKDGASVPPSFYSAVLDEHRNHVHVAISPESIARGHVSFDQFKNAGGGLAAGGIKAQVEAAAAARGWGGQFGALDYIISHESSWNPNIGNPHSTAFGLFQLLYGGHGSVSQQIGAGFNYIAGRYGDPNNAQRFWQSHGWYADGGMPPVGQPFWVGERGPELLRLGPGGRGSRVYSNEESKRMVGTGSPLMHVEHMTVQSDVDFEVKLRQAEFRRQTANGLG